MPVLKQPGTIWARKHPTYSTEETVQATAHMVGAGAPHSCGCWPDYVPRQPQKPPPPKLIHAGEVNSTHVFFQLHW
jgi:hypothetical protein